MLTDDYQRTVQIMGKVITLAELDILVRVITLLVCLITLTVNCIRLKRMR